MNKNNKKIILILLITVMTVSSLALPSTFPFSISMPDLKADTEDIGVLDVKSQNEQDFSKGILAMNINKSIYLSSEALAKEDLPAEMVYIQIAVLDDKARAICDVDLRLEIISPNRNITYAEIQKSGECRPNNVTDVPDYFAYYQTQEIGLYQMRLKNLDNGYEITDSFEVHESALFDVERVGPTRIYPPENYEMKLKIKANQDFKGQIIESVPSGFEIQNQELRINDESIQYSIPNDEDIGYLEIEKLNTKSLIWENITLKQGEELDITYTFNAPDINPYLYLLGPLKLTESGSLSAVFEEGRQWQIASDATNDVFLFWDGTADNPADWICVSCTPGDSYYEYFPRGASTPGGTASSTHTHSTLTLVQDSGPVGGGNIYKAGSGNDIPAATHEHPSVSDSSMSYELALPPYYELKMIKRTSPLGIPKGAIAMFDTSDLPTNWATYTAATVSNYIIRTGPNASSSVSTGHTHSSVTFTVDTSVSTPVTTGSKATQGEQAAHAHSVSGGTSDPATQLPDYIEVILAQATTDTTIPDGMIAMFDDESLPEDWSAVSAFNGNFIQATTTTYGSTEGSSTHNHPNKAFGSGATGDTQASLDAKAAGIGAPIGHTHNVTVSFPNGSNLPPYVDLVFAKYSAPPGVTVSGTVYSDEGVNTLDCGASCTVTLKVNGADACGGECNDTTLSGAYSISGVIIDSANDVITVFLDGESEKAVTVTKADSVEASIENLHLYQNRVIIRHEDSSPVTIADMAQYDSSEDEDVRFTATTTDGLATTTTIFAGNKLYVWPNKTFDPGGTVTVSGNDASSPDGDLHIADGATLIAGGEITLAGDWIASSSAVFTHNNSTTTFNASTTGKQIWTNSQSFSNIHFNDSQGGWTFTSGDHGVDNDFTITQGTVTSTNGTLSVGGSWSNSDTFNATTGTVTFNSSDTGETINPGSSSFNIITFDNAGGGWTITSDATSTNNWNLTNANTFTVDTNVRIEVQGEFSNDVAGANTNWNSGSLLYLNSGSAYAINASTTGDIYNTLQLGTNTDIRMWNSTSSTYTVDSTGSLYSMNHDTDGNGSGDNGYLYIWGDYHVPSGATDYWSYATDFDATPAVNRQVNVRLAANATTTLDIGEELQIIGTGSATTSIDRQESGNYSIRIEAATLNAQYYQIRNTDAYGLYLTGTTTVTSLNYGDYELNYDGGTMMTIASTTINQDAEKTITGCRFSTSTGITSGYNVTATGTATSYWTFAGHYGNYDGEDYDLDPGGNPGYIRWSDSAGLTLTQKDYRWYANIDQLNPTTDLAATNTQITNATSGTVFRIRMNVTANNLDLATSSQAFKLQYASGTDCATISEENWDDLGQTGSSTDWIWRGYDNSSVDDGATTTSLLLSTSDVYGSYEESNDSVSNPNAIPAGQEGEWDWVVQYNTAYSSRTYCFRMIKSGGGTLGGGYTNYPKAVTYQSATWKETENTTTTAATNTDIRLRFLVINSGTGAATDYKYQLEYAARTGDTCGDENFIVMPISTTTGPFEMATSSFFRWGDPTTHRLSDYDSYGVTAGELVEDPYATTGDISLNASTLTEVEYMFHITSDASIGWYCFMVTNEGAALDSYDVYAQLEIAEVVGITFSGTVYSDEGTSVYDCSGNELTVRAKVNGEGSYSGTCTSGDGSYSISGVAVGSVSDVITVFLDGEEEKAVTVTRAADNSSDIDDLHLYKNRVILRHEDSGPITNTNLDQYDKGNDPDIPFTVDGTALSVTTGTKLYIWSEKSFSPGGTITVSGNQAVSPDGDLHIATGATLTAGGNITIAGSWITSSTATFTHNSNTVTLNASTTGKKIWTNSQDFYTLTFNGSGGEWTYQDAATSTATTTITAGTVVQAADYDLTLASLTIQTTNAAFTRATGTGKLYFEGTDPIFIDDEEEDNNLGDVYIGYSPAVVNQNSDIIVDSFTVNLNDTHNTRGYEIDCGSFITVYGTLNANATKETDGSFIYLETDWTIESGGTFTHGNSTTTFDGTGTGNTITTQGTGNPFYDIYFDGSGGGWTFASGDHDVDNDFTINQGTVTSTNGTLLIGGNWLNSDIFNATTGTIVFDSTATGKTINPGNSDFYNLIFDGSGGGWTFNITSATTTNDFTITNGAVTSASSILYIGGNWYVDSTNGLFIHNSATVLFDATDAGHTIIDGGSAFYNITFNGVGGSWLYQDGTSTDPNQTTVENGTSTFLNAKTGPEVSVTGGELNVDWYLGVHIVGAVSPFPNINTSSCDDVIISENTVSSTVWGYIEGVGWGSALNSTTTGTGATCGGPSDGINPQPGTTGAIKIREYSKDSATTSYYKYNLQVDWQSTYGEYDYYDDYGDNYLASASSTDAGGVDKTISDSWHRTSSTTYSSPEACNEGSGSDCINNAPTNGSWYAGLLSALIFEIPSGLSEDFGRLDTSNNWTADASSTLRVTTSASNGYVVTAWAINSAQMKHDDYGSIYIQKYDAINGSPEVWDQNCLQNPSCCGFGYTTNDSSLSGGTDDRFTSGSTSCTGGAGSGAAYAGFAISGGDPVADYSNSTTTDETIITYKASVNSVQTAGDYSTTVIYVCTANY